jgi:uncharacterized protein (DUF1778 family)
VATRKRRPAVPPKDAAKLPKDELAIVKIRLNAAELRRLRLAAALVNESHVGFVRAAALEKAESLLRDAGLKQFLAGMDSKK